MEKYGFVIVGAGIMGLAIAFEINRVFPNEKILIIEKESQVALHASGRNSGVLHAGFYYSADSLKARTCVYGHQLMKDFVRENNLSLNPCGKVVVCCSEEELESLHILFARGRENGSRIEIVSSQALQKLEPNAKTFKEAIFSADTASVDPSEVCRRLQAILEEKGVSFLFSQPVVFGGENWIETKNKRIHFDFMINCAGLYADRIASFFQAGLEYTILPFKGLYLFCKSNRALLKRHVYPVPNLKNPFLGVHFTLTAAGHVKIGPTAIPAFWREHYQGFENFSLSEAREILSLQSRLFLKNSFHFRELAFEEIKKYYHPFLIHEASNLVFELAAEFTPKAPGIRAQLVHKKKLELVMDFILEKRENTLHLLNAVSPAFTSSFAMAKEVVKRI